MFKKIVVPLDGSDLGESVLPCVERMVEGSKVEVDVLMVIPHITTSYTFADQKYVEKLDQEIIGKERAQVDGYLAKVSKDMEAKGIKTRTSVHVGDPASEIVIHANAAKADLIVMATHGRSGPGRVVFGSVADKVLRTSKMPVMTVRPEGCKPK